MKTIKPKHRMKNGNSGTPGASSVDSTASEAYVNFYDVLHRYLVKSLGSTWDADDALQEVYLRVLKHHNPQFKPSLSFLFRVASNLLKDKFRSQRVRAQYPIVPIEEDKLMTATETPEQLLRAKQGAEALRNLFAILNPTSQRIFLLHRFKGLTYEEIAKEMGITKNEVKYRIRQVLLQVRNHIGDYL